jgi:type II secretion system protein G
MLTPKRQSTSGFTLIELLIVVAIIAILALIAVPNFLEAHTRAKVSRAKNDMRSLRLALEAYRLDEPSYPKDIFGVGTWTTWYQLTTPVAYMTSVPPSPFKYRAYISAGYNDPGLPPYDYAQYDHVLTYRGETSLRPVAIACQAVSIFYVVTCAGPDEDNDMNWSITDGLGRQDAAAYQMVYDPTNGTVSSGDIIMTSRGFHG